MDVDKLRDQVIDAEEWELLQEAVTCLDAGAVRAAYVMAWVAGAEVLTRRLGVLSQGHGGLAKELGNYRKSPMDATLIDLAAKYLYITDAEKAQLAALLKHRHEYAHPNESRPQRFQVEFSIEYLVRTVLGRPARATAATARTLGEQASTDPYLVHPGAEAAREWVEETALLISEEARPVFWNALLTATPGKGQRSDLQERRRVIAETLLLLWQPDLSRGQWHLRERLDDRGELLVPLLLVVDRWPTVPEGHRPIIVQMVLQDHWAFDLGWPELLDLVRDSSVDVTTHEAVLRHIHGSSFEKLQRHGAAPVFEAFERIVDRLSKSHGHAAYQAALVLDTARVADFAMLTNEQQEKLAEALHTASTSGNSYGARNVLNRLLQDKGDTRFYERLG